VFIDLPPARPEAHVVGPARGVVTLALPLSREEVETLVHAYFRAFLGGEGPSFGPLLTRDARRLDGDSPSDLAASLEARIRAVDYSHMPMDGVVAYGELRLVAYDAAPERMRELDAMREGDVLVDVPMRVQRFGIMRVFGARVVLVLRREGSGGAWKIAGVREDGGPWS
jgi:hypothetical protein